MPRLTDRRALMRNRARAARQGPALFLHETALDEVKDRLSMVNRTFSNPAIVTGFPDFWAAQWPGAKIVPDDEVLTLDPGTHDLVIHAMALHWANDPVGQLIQCRRALKPDGLFLSVAFGGQTLAGLRTALAEAESQLTGGLSPRVAPMAEIRDMGALLQRAGLALPVADAVPLRVSYADSFALMRDLRAMGEGNALQARLRRPTRAGVLARAAAIHAGLAETDGGRITETFELVVLTGWAPDDSQPQPLRPGSARTRLADALGTRETPLHD
ncbi:Methyltransferase domain-containing protein [Lutimaribacter pacificus]|uniref:Methyltransferase domain-containing protein n=2 Tax=Lutimaribacter pacificus TaxID=391948 RepID=A0A1H0EHN1_9RHOB|nr:Methyltransferase domain-containing protein [Lutimaribacter pacificus]SHK52983.1 Methyltransferase domain-containing protein [Lutimaribacter pacificus]